MVDSYWRKIDDNINNLENSIQISSILLKLKEHDTKITKIDSNIKDISSNKIKIDTNIKDISYNTNNITNLKKMNTILDETYTISKKIW